MSEYKKYRVMTKDEIDEVTEMVREGLQRLAYHNKWMNQHIEARKEINERTQATKKRNREAKLAAQAKETTK